MFSVNLTGMRTRIRCHSTGNRRLLRPSVNDAQRSASIQPLAKTQAKDVVVIGKEYTMLTKKRALFYIVRLFVGNGPSAITLSYLLSGHWPHYKGQDNMGHPPEFLHARLEAQSGIPLVLQNLEELAEVSCSSVI